MTGCSVFERAKVKVSKQGEFTHFFKSNSYRDNTYRKLAERIVKQIVKQTEEYIMQVLYKATATSTAGRDGRAVSSDGVLDVKLSTPKELGGAGGAATNPEQLFAAGYSACFLSALKYVASQQKVLVSSDAKITAEVGIYP